MLEEHDLKRVLQKRLTQSPTLKLDTNTAANSHHSYSPMRTRSQTNKIDIDFDEASAAWMANKVRRGAMVYYLCTATQKSGKPCTRISSNEETAKHPDRSQLCTQHARYGHSNTSTDVSNSANSKANA